MKQVTSIITLKSLIDQTYIAVMWLLLNKTKHKKTNFVENQIQPGIQYKVLYLI
jgi:hypothetical protein